MSRASDLANLIASGSTTIHGEAGVTSSDSTGKTTNLQQGLTKAWANYEQSSSHTIRDSLNVGSLGDLGAGQTQINFTTNFAAAQWAGASNVQQADTVTPGSSFCDVSQIHQTQQTNFAKMFSNTNFSNTSVGDATYCQIILHGDLA